MEVHFLDLIHFHVVGLADAVVLFVYFLVGGNDLFQLNDLLQCETGLDLALSLGSHLLSHCVEIEAGVLEVGLEVETLHAQTVVEVADEVLGLSVEHGLGDLSLELFDEGVNDLLFYFVLSGLVVSLLNLCLDVSLIFIKGVKFGNILCKLVVKLGKLIELDLVQLALEDCGLACKLLCMVIFREGYIDIELVADVLADASGNQASRHVC